MVDTKLPVAPVVSVPRPRRSYVYREKSERGGELIKALAAAQGEFSPVIKDSQAQYGWFASLTSMRRATAPALSKHGLAIHFECADMDETPYLVCVLSHESDQFVSSVIRMERIADPQKRSAYMTYMKRAAYSAILCLAAEDDDDGDAASAATTEAQAEEWKETFRLAKDAIQSATNVSRVNAILAKVFEKAQAGQMDPKSVSLLDEIAVSRKEALSQEKEVAK